MVRASVLRIVGFLLTYRCIAVVVMGGVFIGSLIWYFFPKYGGRYWFKGPVPTVGAMVEEDSGEEHIKSENDKKGYTTAEAMGA